MLKKFLLFLLPLVILITVIGQVLRQHSDASRDKGPVYAVKPVDLLISVIEGGELEAINEVLIKSKLDEATRILWLIEEATWVKKGDLLVELDSSGIQNRLLQADLNYQTALSALSRAEEDLEITKDHNKSIILEAELQLDIAQMELEKYLKGLWPLEKKKQEAKITIAKSELSSAKDRLSWTEKLHNKGYASALELETDRLNVRKKQIALDQAKEEWRIMQTYEQVQKVNILKSTIEKRKQDLVQKRRKARSNENRLKIDFQAKKNLLPYRKKNINRLRSS